MASTRDLTVGHPFKVMALFSLPMFVSVVFQQLYSMADTLFVGLLNDSIQTSAVTLAAPVILSFNAINNLFGIGTSSLLSRSLGIKDYYDTLLFWHERRLMTEDS